MHYDSPDERGIDVALLYNKDFFEVISSTTHTLDLTDEDGLVDYTRDLLVVKGVFNRDILHVMVNHWHTRREGEEETKINRIKAAQLMQSVVREIKASDEESKFIIMGDFNDDPVSESVHDYLVTDDFYNPMKSLFEKGEGTSTYYGKWHLFDQIIFSKEFF